MNTFLRAMGAALSVAGFLLLCLGLLSWLSVLPSIGFLWAIGWV